MRRSAALLATMTVLLVSSAASAGDVRRVDEPDAQLVIGMIGAGTVHVLVDVTGYLQ